MTKTIEKIIECEHCKKTYVFDVQLEGLELWEKGRSIQEVLPELDAGQRELMISGTCDACFDKFFGDDK